MKKTVLLFIFLFSSCSVNYIEKLKNTEHSFYQGKFDIAVDEARELVKSSDEKDKLLLLMEAGIILHSMGDYEKSNLAFKDADYIAETIKTSVSKQAAAFLLNDTKANYKGENFERVLIKFYIALNYLMLNDLEAAKRYFKKLDFDLKEMKYGDKKYKQNAVARYLDAVVSEYLKKYNDARVQYKNLQMIYPDNSDLLSARYILACKEGETEDREKYKKGRNYLHSFNNTLQPKEYDTKMGELIIIHQAGKAPQKVSRGELLNDQQFLVALRAAIYVALVAEGAALSTTAVLAMMSTAENPVPVYQPRDKRGSKEINVLLNNIPVGRTGILNDYTETAIRNYNDNYSSLVTKNVASIALKIVLAAIASHKLSQSIEKSTDSGFLVSKLIRFGIGAGAGKAVAATVEPDLRCWRLLPSNFQIIRIFLDPGEYQLSFQFNNSYSLATYNPGKIKIESGKPTFLTFRSLTRVK